MWVGLYKMTLECLNYFTKEVLVIIISFTIDEKFMVKYFNFTRQPLKLFHSCIIQVRLKFYDVCIFGDFESRTSLE